MQEGVVLMTESISISLDALQSLLEKAYEQGWKGYLEMKRDCARSIVDDYIAARPSGPVSIHTDNTSLFTVSSSEPGKFPGSGISLSVSTTDYYPYLGGRHSASAEEII